MEYEPGCEKYHFRETWRERHGLTWNNFLNNWGFAIPLILFLTAAWFLAHAVDSARAGELPQQEKHAMLSTCGKLGDPNDRQLCKDAVEDPNVGANYKRSCFEAATLLMKGTGWARVKSLPPTTTCSIGLRRAGYPITHVLSRLSR